MYLTVWLQDPNHFESLRKVEQVEDALYIWVGVSWTELEIAGSVHRYKELNS